LTIGVGILIFGLVIFSLTQSKLDSFQLVSYALIASGGGSNWIDRARFGGSVVDFMNMGIGPVRTGVFNVADIAIMAGIGMLFLHGWLHEKRAKHAAAAKPPTEER
jgi:signal peptidase II